MQEQQNSSTAILDDDGVGRIEDAFRRATFDWARSTKRLVDIASYLGKNTRVARAALADVEHVRDMLDSLYLPQITMTPAAMVDGKAQITVAEVQQCVSNLATRISVASQVQAHVDEIVGAPPIVRKTPFNARVEPSRHRGVDMSAPVYSKNGKMLWAGVDCPACPSKASQRCQREDGVFIEKPHTPRKALAEQDQNT